MSINVVSYNVLSSHLGGKDYFIYCNPDDLNADTRYARVLEKLAPHVASGAVLCLQELSLPWTGRLHAFFNQHGYHFAACNYGSAFSG